jgi:hypothetical protein
VTFVQAVIAKDWVVLTSDRRITRREWTSKGWKLISQEDSATKSAIIDQHYVLGFAGLGGVKGQSMEDWLSDALIDIPEDKHMFEVLGEKITTVGQEINLSGMHTFLAVGFEKSAITGAYEPELFLLSNHLSGDEQVFAERAMFPQEFAGIRYVLDTADPDERAYVCIGGRPDAELAARTRHHLGSLPLANDPDYVIGVLLNAQRETAERSNGVVGRSTLVTWIPKRALPLSLQPPSPAEHTGPHYLNEHETSLFIADPEIVHESVRTFYSPARFSRFLHVAGVLLEVSDEPFETAPGDPAS